MIVIVRNVFMASVLLACTPAAQAACFHKPGDKTETIAEIDGGSALVWRHRGKRIAFQTGSGGTGVGYRIAYDRNLKGFRYEHRGKNLVFGGVTYVPGC